MFTVTWEGGRRLAVWDLLSSGMHLLGSRALADVRKGLCCPQTEARVATTHSPLRTLPEDSIRWSLPPSKECNAARAGTEH